MCCALQAEIPASVGVLEEAEVAMETEEGKTGTSKKFFIDTNSLRVPRKGMEVQTFLKDGMSMSHYLLH